MKRRESKFKYFDNQYSQMMNTLLSAFDFPEPVVQMIKFMWENHPEECKDYLFDYLWSINQKVFPQLMSYIKTNMTEEDHDFSVDFFEETVRSTELSLVPANSAPLGIEPDEVIRYTAKYLSNWFSTKFDFNYNQTAKKAV